MWSIPIRSWIGPAGDSKLLATDGKSDLALLRVQHMHDPSLHFLVAFWFLISNGGGSNFRMIRWQLVSHFFTPVANEEITNVGIIEWLYYFHPTTSRATTAAVGEQLLSMGER
jgi:hypothetical protein